MKITEITIVLTPSVTDAGEFVKRTLHRTADKQWHVLTDDDKKGLFPGEIELINSIQNDVIKKFNAFRGNT